MHSKIIRVGVFGNDYAVIRMIRNKAPNVQYFELQNKLSLNRLFFRILGKMFPKYKYSDVYSQHVTFVLNPKKEDVDVIHLFNRVNLNDKYRWVSTFEKTFPEYSSSESNLDKVNLRKLIEIVSKDNCLKILALSKWALNYEKWLLDTCSNSIVASKIINKTQVLYPPQKLYINEEEVKQKFNNLKKVTVIFVGRQMKRKGGLNLLRAAVSLHDKIDFSLIYIGSKQQGYNNYFLSEGEIREFDNIINSCAWIKYYSELDNEKVIKLLLKSHVGVLPTLGDTFGFSVLEMQACGCPVITTNREAMCEINNEKIGWMIDTKKLKISQGDDYGNYTQEEIEMISREIDKQLPIILEQAISHKSELMVKAIGCIQKIRSVHSPEKYAEQLTEIYQTKE